MSMPRLTLAFACLLSVALLAGCGGDDSDDSATSSEVESRPAPPKGAFPAPDGRSLAEVVKLGKRAEVVVSPAALAFEQGENRYPFGVFSLGREQIADAEVALYIAKAPPPKAGPREKRGKGAVARARDEALDQPALGPFPARVEDLTTQPAFRAQTTSDDPDAATVVYSTQLDFQSKGDWRIAALIREGDELSATVLPSASVGEFKRLPREGERPPRIHTPTAAEAGSDLASITTRIPPDTQNQVDFADVLGKEPIVLLFATPQFCQSRVCGPVVDVAEQAKEKYGDRAAFIHMEIFKENDPNRGVREQVRAFHLPSEPWLFVIDEEGRISDAVEGAFGPELLTEAVERVVG
jgi:hypothetical protein